MEDEEFVGCISCMNTNDLCDLFALYAENKETYAKMFETCFDIKVILWLFLILVCSLEVVNRFYIRSILTFCISDLCL